MRVTVDLAGLVNAEFMSRDGVPGVFIPLVPNVVHKVDAGGRHAYALFRLHTAPAKKDYDLYGRQNIPMDHRDKYLENPMYAGKPPRVIWAWDDGDIEPGGPVGQGYLESLLDGK